MFSLEHWQTALGAGAVATGIFVFWRHKENRKRWRPEPERKATYFSLLPFEHLSFLYMPGEDLAIVKSITFYNGEPPIAALRERISTFVDANPWAAARIVNTQSGPKFWVPHAADEVDKSRLLVELEDKNLHPDISLDMLECTLAALKKKDIFCKEAYYCQDRDEPMCRVAVVRTSPATFALVTSMNHCVGDGHSFYIFHNALDVDPDGAKPVMSMSFQRNFEASRGAEELLGVQKTRWSESISFFMGMFIMKNFRPPHCKSVWKVSSEWLAEQKKNAAGEDVPFVSSNDAITSWFLGSSRFCNIGLMAINMRGRISKLGDKHVGNYESIMVFQKGECKSPADIRHAVMGPKLGTRRAEAPGLCMSLQSRVGLVTNWSTFAKDVRLPGCVEVLHLGTFGSDMLFAECAVIFRARKGELGVILWQRGGQQVPETWERLM